MAKRQKNREEAEVTFGDVFYEPRLRKAQNEFLNQVDQLIDWRPIRTLINKKYTKRENAVGAPAYDSILLFKMLLLQTWYNLSDVALEERINDSITFSRFLGLKLEDVSPDHSTLSRFRTSLTELNLMDKLLKKVNSQLILEGEEIPEETPVFADKGYASHENREYLESRGLQDRIMQKAYRNRPLTEHQKSINKTISPIRSAIERTFGSIRRWFHGGQCRYRGLAKTHTQNVLECIAFNLYRTPGIIMSNCIK